MMTKDYQGENDLILEEWRNASLENERDKNAAFVKDGLMYRGRIYYEDNIWYRERSNENELWSSAFPKIMLITKDYNDQEGHDSNDELDLRNETLRKNFTGEENVITSSLRFHSSMMHHVYGLGNYKDGKCPLWGNLYPDACREFYETYPLVRINVKKQGGGGSVQNSSLIDYIETYKEYLNRQIRLFLDADIIVCYGRVIFNYVIGEFFPDVEVLQNDPWVYFSEAKQKVIINSYHPSVRPFTISDYNFYSYPMAEFEHMMEKHRSFASKFS